ncbi:MAG: lactate utilization protein [Treponema sp.]|jgi:L-lactate utilization protein LutB|nr:lactate utilization protein [Treponema sp.]
MAVEKEFIDARASKLGPRVVKALIERHFDAWYFDGIEAANEKILSLIPRDHVVSWGGSMTVKELKVLPLIEERGNKTLNRDTAKPEEKTEIGRQALLCDTYIAGINGISEDGQIVNIDGNGNRVAATIFGPRQVILIAGINKVAKTLDDAMTRARTVAAPLNVQRFSALKTPCQVSGSCADCKSPDSVCSFIAITRLCKPAGRIKVILIGQTLGF